MTFEGHAVLAGTAEWEEAPAPRKRWGVTSETGRLSDVLLSEPRHLAMIPCNEVTKEWLADGHRTCSASAAGQHKAFADALRIAGVTSWFVPARSGMADLSFTRDAVTMTPWGAVGLRPAVTHRRAETDHVLATLRTIGVPVAGRIEQGHVEGGDVCLVRNGLVLIGVSDDRTDEAGARQLGAFFERKGWRAMTTRLDSKFLHLDTVLSMASDDVAVACRDALDPELLRELVGLGIELVEASLEDVSALGANIFSLGGGRVVASSATPGINSALAKHGLDVIGVEIGEFAKCGGGPHCLTMPLLRAD